MAMHWSDIRGRFAQLVDVAQNTHGLTQEEIATAAGLSKNAVSRILSNARRGPTVDTFVKALAGLGITPSDFFAALESNAAIVAAAAQKGSHDVDIVATVPLTRTEVETIALAAVAKFFISTRADLTVGPRVDDDRTANAAPAAPEPAAGRDHSGYAAPSTELRRHPRRPGPVLDQIAHRHAVTSDQLHALVAEKKTG